MITYYYDKTKIEKNALDEVLIKEPVMDSICVFPDIHYCSEHAMPVGVAFKSIDKFYPLVTGKDVGCGVAFLKFPKKSWKKDFNKFEHYNAFNKASQNFTDEGLGGGNHFLSIEDGDDEYTYIVCHTGTRNLGIYMYQFLLSLINGFNYKEGIVDTFLPIEYYTEQLHDKYSNVVLTGTNRRKEFLIKTLEFLQHNNYVDKCSYDIQDSIHNVFRITDNYAIHRKGATELINNNPVVIPISMTRGSLIVKAKPGIDQNLNLWSCAHGAGRRLSRTDTLKHWYSLKNKEKKLYEQKFIELLDRNGKFANGYLQEFDFAYKNTDSILIDQPFLKEITKTTPIVTIKYTEI